MHSAHEIQKHELEAICVIIKLCVNYSPEQYKEIVTIVYSRMCVSM